MLPNVTNYTATTTLPGGEVRQWPQKRVAKQRIAYVCDRCNGGWMCELEGAAKPVLTPMFGGRRQNLAKREQRTLAAWAFKTAAVGEYVDPRNAVLPFRERTWLRTHGEPPKDALVFIAGVDIRWGGGTNFDTYRLVPEVLGNKGYVATMLVEYVALQVIWADFGKAAFNHESIARIWPFERAFRWPPGPILPVPAIEWFTNAWRRP